MLYIFRTPFVKNTSGRLLLKFFVSSFIIFGFPIRLSHSSVMSDIIIIACSSYSCNNSNPANIYLFKINDGNTRRRCERNSKLTIKTPEPRIVCGGITPLLVTTPLPSLLVTHPFLEFCYPTPHHPMKAIDKWGF